MRLAADEVRRRKLDVIHAVRDHVRLTIENACYCDECFHADMCPYAFDLYNWSEQDDFCLAEK